MPLVESTIEIAVARADVFRFCHNVNRWHEWHELAAHVELLTPAPVRGGTLLRIDAQQTGSAVFSWDAEFAEMQFPHGSKLRVIDAASSSPFGKGSEQKWQFESVGHSTRLTWQWHYQPQGFLGRMADKLGGKSAAQKAVRRSLANLKRILESGRNIGAA